MNTTLTRLKVNLHNTFPPVMHRLLNEAVKEVPDFSAIAETIGMDPALAVSVLNLVNSSFYGLSQKVVDLQRAAVVLGVQELLKLALSVSFHQNMVQNGQKNERAYANWRMLVWSAVACELIAAIHSKDNVSRLYLCALLKDLSLVVLERTDPHQFQSWGTTPLLCPFPGQQKSEKKLFGVDHAQLTLNLLNELDLSGIGCDCVAHHHDMEGITRHDAPTQCLILATRWSEVELGCSRDPQQLLYFEAICRRILNLDQDSMDALRTSIVMRFSSMLSTLGIAEAPPESQFYRHSLFEIQRANFLASGISNPAGGLSSIAGILHRILTLTFDLTDWELALLGPDKHYWNIFSCTNGELSGPQAKCPADLPVPWTREGKSIPLQVAETSYGALHLSATPKNHSANSLRLQLKFAAHAYENYLLRQAHLETKASILDQLPIGVARMDPRGTILNANEQFIKYFKLPADFRGTSAKEIAATVLGGEAEEKLKAFLKNDEQHLSKLFYIHSEQCDEHVLYASLHKGGALGEHILALVEDISDVSSLEVQSIKQLGFLNALVESMRDIVLTVDEAGNITYASPNAPSSLTGQNLFSTAVPASKSIPLPNADRLDEMTGPYEVLLETEGKYIPLELIFSPLRETRGNKQYLVVGRDLTTIRRLEEELRRKAVYDGLTGLLNHSQFQTVLERELKRTARSGKSLGLLFMDLDGFKNINDTKGHLAGDAVLRKVGRILLSACRKDSMDYPCRYGGDEFAIIYTEVDHAFLESAFSRLQKGFQQMFENGLGFSAGLAIAGPEEKSAELLRRTDKATYRAKSMGGMRFAWAEAPPTKV